MVEKLYISASGLQEVSAIGRINIFEYLIDAELFFIVNIDPRLDEIYGAGTVDYTQDMCDLYIADLYF